MEFNTNMMIQTKENVKIEKRNYSGVFSLVLGILGLAAFIGGFLFLVLSSEQVVTFITGGALVIVGAMSLIALFAKWIKKL